MTCPYREIDSHAEPRAAAGRPRVVCVNCRNYALATRDRRESEPADPASPKES